MIFVFYRLQLFFLTLTQGFREVDDRFGKQIAFFTFLSQNGHAQAFEPKRFAAVCASRDVELYRFAHGWHFNLTTQCGGVEINRQVKLQIVALAGESFVWEYFDEQIQVRAIRLTAQAHFRAGVHAGRDAGVYFAPINELQTA